MSLLLVHLRTYCQAAVLLLLVLHRTHARWEVNTGMKKALRGGYSNTQKKDKELSFHKFPRDVSLREKWFNSINRKDFIPGEEHHICSQHFYVPKSKAHRMSLLYFHCFLSPNRESLQKYICHSNLQPKRRKLELENQNP